MIYWLGLITFLVAQMAEILVWAISQHDRINSQLPYQNMRGLFLGKRLHRHIYGGVSVVFLTIHTVLPLFSTCCVLLRKVSSQLSVQ